MNVKTEQELSAMRQSGQILARVLATLKSQTVAGVSANELDEAAARAIKAHGATASFLGYNGYPKSICISINDQVQHGIPSDRIIKEGDLVNLDLGVTYDGMITDAGLTFGVGVIDAAATTLIKATEEALMAGIDQVRGGVHVRDVSSAIEARLERDNLGIVTELVGHGVGHKLHEPPNIPNFTGAGQGPVLKAGMTIAIEPMATLGSREIVIAGDGWTIYTADGSLAAHFEHTILVTPEGAEILTLL
jgi:methionyl aminopeptidase